MTTRAACCLLLAACCLLPSAAQAGFGEGFIKPEDTLEIRREEIVDSRIAPHVNRPLDKLGRGITNLFTSPLEWPVTFRELRKQRGWGSALLRGPLLGTGRAVTRLASGAVDTLTCLVPPPRRALWVRRPSLLGQDTTRSAWVLEEAATAQQELSRPQP